MEYKKTGLFQSFITKTQLEGNENQRLMIHTGRMSMIPVGTFPLIYFAYGLFNDSS